LAIKVKRPTSCILMGKKREKLNNALKETVCAVEIEGQRWCPAKRKLFGTNIVRGYQNARGAVGR